MNSFVLETASTPLVNRTKNIATSLSLFGLPEQRQPYFISEGAPIAFYPEEGFRADYYIYAICLSGTAAISLNGERIRLTPNDFFAAIPSTAIQLFEHSNRFKVKLLLFERSFLLKNISDTRQLEQLGFFNFDTLAHVHLSKPQAMVLKNKLNAIKTQSTRKGIFHDTIMQSLIINLLFETAEIYFEHRESVQKKALSNQEHLFMQFMKLVGFNFREQQELDFYADKLFISKKYLIAVCKNVSGKTPGTLIAEARLAEAKLLLALPDQNVSSVSAALNYATVAAFSKFFKKHTGTAPAGYPGR